MKYRSVCYALRLCLHITYANGIATTTTRTRTKEPRPRDSLSTTIRIITRDTLTSGVTRRCEGLLLAEGDKTRPRVTLLQHPHLLRLRQWRSSRTRAGEGPVLSPIVRDPFYYPFGSDPRGLTWPPGPHVAPTCSSLSRTNAPTSELWQNFVANRRLLPRR